MAVRLERGGFQDTSKVSEAEAQDCVLKSGHWAKRQVLEAVKLVAAGSFGRCKRLVAPYFGIYTPRLITSKFEREG